MARYIYLLCAFLCCVSFAHGQRIQGKIIDEGKGESLPFANVSLLKDGVFITGATSDFDGNYVISGFDPGTYTLRVEYVGYATNEIPGIVVGGSKTVPYDVQMREGEDLTEIVVTEYTTPLIEADNTSSGQTLSAEDVQNVATRSVTTLISTTAGISSSVREGSALSIRGARNGDQIIYVDGVRTRGSSVQARDVEQIQVFTGGLPAEYGDVTGGIINITTKGPSQSFSGSLEAETSELLDPYGYNFVNLSLAGPILQREVTDASGKTRKESILGYRLSGIYRTSKDASPGFLGGSTITDEYRDLISADPLAETNQGFNPRFVTVDEEDVILTDEQQNNRTNTININGKLDLRVNKAIDMTVGGNLNYSTDEQAFSVYQTFNSARNPLQTDLDWRVFGRFRHRIGNTTPKEGEDNTSWITNVIYTLQFDYSRTQRLLQDNVHEDNF
ncbi:MAG: carboxypeptidase regulatory-like domain-containing protein, partial [Bacteroidota bacterium]